MSQSECQEGCAKGATSGLPTPCTMLCCDPAAATRSSLCMLASSSTGGQAFPEGLPDGAPLPRSALRKPPRPTRFDAAVASSQQAAGNGSVLGKRPQPETAATPAAEPARSRQRVESATTAPAAPVTAAAAATAVPGTAQP